MKNLLLLLSFFASSAFATPVSINRLAPYETRRIPELGISIINNTNYPMSIGGELRIVQRPGPITPTPTPAPAPTPTPAPVTPPKPVLKKKFTIPPRAGIVSCNDPSVGGRAGAIVDQCIRAGSGRNNGCRQLNETTCQAWEGDGNGGSAACQVVCGFVKPPVDFVLPGGAGLISCNNPAQGGHPGAALVECQNAGTGRNNGCRAVNDTTCEAWEGSGNGGSAGCRALCYDP